MEQRILLLEQRLNSLENVQIGGRNIALNTRKFFDGKQTGNAGGVVSNMEIVLDSEVPSGYAVKYDYSKSSTWQIGVFFRVPLSELVNGQIYTASFFAKSSVDTYFKNDFVYEGQEKIKGYEDVNITSQWKRYVEVFKVTSNSRTLVFYVDKGDCTIYLSSLKIERYNTPTDWTPAPEDLVFKSDQ